MPAANSIPAAPSTAWKELIDPGEAKLHAEHLLAFDEIRRIKDARYGKGRQLHRDAKLCLHANFEVLSDIPHQAKNGLFASPGTYAAWVRLSNGGMDRAPDRKPDLRGFSIKVRGLRGACALGSGDTDCQDFLMIQKPAFVFANSKEFVGFALHAARGPIALLKYVYLTFGFLGGVKKLLAMVKAFKTPFSGFATEKFHTAAPLACGPYAVRVRMLPASTDANANPDKSWAKDFRSHLAKRPLRFELQLQFFVDDQRTPIEQDAKIWSEEASPYVTVAVLTIPMQDTESTEATKIAAVIEAAAFNPWGGLMAHRPLGEVMRARKAVYFQSFAARHAECER